MSRFYPCGLCRVHYVDSHVDLLSLFYAEESEVRWGVQGHTSWWGGELRWEPCSLALRSLHHLPSFCLESAEQRDMDIWIKDTFLFETWWH